MELGRRQLAQVCQMKIIDPDLPRRGRLADRHGAGARLKRDPARADRERVGGGRRVDCRYP